VHTEANVALTLLGDYVNNKFVLLKTSVTMGLGFAYASSHWEDLCSSLLPHIADNSASMKIASSSALTLHKAVIITYLCETLQTLSQ
jgi:26S proteasome regulatory subunit N1